MNTVTTRMAVTFTAARHELIGPDALLGAAEIARGTCRQASRRLGLLSITRQRMRRVDGWFGPEGLVTHPIAPTPETPVIGTLCALEHADDLIAGIIEAITGPMPAGPASRRLLLEDLGGLAPVKLADGVAWVLVISVVTAIDTVRWVVAGTDDGLVAGLAGDPRQRVTLDPIGPLPNWARISRLLAPSTPTAPAIDDRFIP